MRIRTCILCGFIPCSATDHSQTLARKIEWSVALHGDTPQQIAQKIELLKSSMITGRGRTSGGRAPSARGLLGAAPSPQPLLLLLALPRCTCTPPPPLMTALSLGTAPSLPGVGVCVGGGGDVVAPRSSPLSLSLSLSSPHACPCHSTAEGSGWGNQPAEMSWQRSYQGQSPAHIHCLGNVLRKISDKMYPRASSASDPPGLVALTTLGLQSCKDFRWRWHPVLGLLLG